MFKCVCVCVCVCVCLCLVVFIDQMELPYRLTVTKYSMSHRPGMLQLFFLGYPRSILVPRVFSFLLGPFLMIYMREYPARDECICSGGPSMVPEPSVFILPDQMLAH